MEKASPQLLEPMMKVEVETPDEYQGDIMGDLNRRRGQIQNVSGKTAFVSISAMVPCKKCSAMRPSFAHSVRAALPTVWSPNLSNQFRKSSSTAS